MVICRHDSGGVLWRLSTLAGIGFFAFPGLGDQILRIQSHKLRLICFDPCAQFISEPGPLARILVCVLTMPFHCDSNIDACYDV